MSSKVASSLDELLDILSRTEDFTLPSYRELPGVELYMEQVLKYVNLTIEPVTGKDNSLTSFMVNNYVKSKMIPEPSKKKYSKEQIGSLIAITLMKPTLSMADMATLLEFEPRVSEDKNKLYSFWSDLEEKLLHSISLDTKNKVEKVKAIHEKYGKSDPERMDALALDQLAYLALRLSIEAQTNKLLSEAIIDKIRSSRPVKESKPVEAIEEKKPAKKKSKKDNRKKK
ncbi:MAG: DUF1836 domain-containing protein [Bacilli bacterium]|nr:DUF1836 domain-containing protein [Bacilli bacterium]